MRDHRRRRRKEGSLSSPYSLHYSRAAVLERWPARKGTVRVESPRRFPMRCPNQGCQNEESSFSFLVIFDRSERNLRSENPGPHIQRSCPLALFSVLFRYVEPITADSLFSRESPCSTRAVNHQYLFLPYLDFSGTWPLVIP